MYIGNLEKKGKLNIAFAGYRSQAFLIFDEVREDFYDIEFYVNSNLIFTYKKDTIQDVRRGENYISFDDMQKINIQVTFSQD